MKYNLSKIMLKAWKVYRKTKNISFAEALHRAWLSAKAEEINAKRIEDAKHAAGITEETNTFAKWKELLLLSMECSSMDLPTYKA